MSAPAAYVFDLFGTLLDFGSLRDRFVSHTNEPDHLVLLWRLKQLALAFCSTLMERYEDFDAITERALEYAAAQLNVSLTSHEREQLCDAWSVLPLYPDVAPALETLAGRGDRLAVLSNGTPRTIERSLKHAGVAELFYTLLSVDAVRKYKPSPAAYQLASDRLELDPPSIAFVSSNGWDASGAAEFGFRVFRCNRGAVPAEPLWAQPERTIETLRELE